MVRRRLLRWSLGLLLAAAAGIAVFLATLDAGVYRRAVERELSAALGRTVSVGSVSVKLALTPTLSARDLRIANPAWASRPDLGTAASCEVRVDLVALWQGKVEVRALHLRGADLLLERDAATSTGNWAFGTSAPGAAPMALPDFDALSLADSRIAWLHGGGEKTQLLVDHLEATIRQGAPFALQGQVAYRDAPMRLAVKADASLQAGLAGKPWQVAVTLQPKGASLTLDARLASLDSLEGGVLGFEANGEGLDAWSAIVGVALPAWGPYRLSGQTHVTTTGLQVEELRLSLDGLPMQPSHLEIGTGTAVLGAAIDSQLSVQGTIGNTAFSLDARSAPLPTLLKAGGALPLTMHATLAQFSLSAEGRVALTTDVPHFDLALTGRGDALALARVFASVPPRRSLPIDLSLRVSHAQDGYAARNIRGRVMGTRVGGELAYSTTPRALLTGALDIDRLDLGQMGDERARTSTPAGTPSWLGRVETDVLLHVATIAGLPVTAEKVSTRLQWQAGVVGLRGLSANLSDIGVTGDGSLRWADGRAQVDGAVRIALLDLAKLRVQSAGSAGPGNGSAFDLALPLAPLRATDAKLQIDIARIAGLAVPVSNVAARVRLQNGRLAVDMASATAADVALHGQATLDANGSTWRVDGNAKAERVDVAALLRSLAQPAAASGMIDDLQLAFAAQGMSVRALLAQATLALRSAPFSLMVGRDRNSVAVRHASVEVEPGGPLRASASVDAFGAPMDLTVVGGSLEELLDFDNAWPKVQADLRTTWGREPVHVSATSGPLQRLIALRDVPLSLQATLPGAQASLQGTVGNLAAPTATPLNGRVTIVNLAQTGALLTTARLPAIPFTAAGRIALGSGEVTIDELSAQAGRSDASGRLRIRWQDRPQISADLTARLIDTTQWDTSAAGEPSVLDRPIAVQPLLSQDAQLHLQAERFILPSYDLARLRLDGTLAHGLVELSAAAAEGDLHGDLRFDVKRDLPGVALHLSLKEVEAQTLYTAAAAPSGANSPRLSIGAQWAGSGTTLRDMLATGQGELLLTAGAGTLPAGASRGLERVADNLLLVLLPRRRTSDDAALECAAARFSIANGVATSSDGIALRLKHIDILGSGAANLKTGEILFGYRAVRREFLSFSLLGLTSGFAKVTGTIGDPRVALDPAGLLVEGAAAWATVGLSLLASDLWRKLESTSDPCARIAAGARTMRDPLEALISALPAAKLPASSPGTP